MHKRPLKLAGIGCKNYFHPLTNLKTLYMKQNYIVSGKKLRDYFRRSYHLSTVIFVFLLAGIQMSQAQKGMQRMPGVPVVCPANYEDQHSRMAMSQMAAKKSSALVGKKQATAELLITFGPGAEGNTDVQEAFQFALDIWSEEIVSSEPIRIFADFANLGTGVLASAGPTTLISNFPNAPVPDVFFPIALANSLAGEDLAPDEEFDLVVNIGNGIPWYFGTDGNTPAGQFDFVTVALHEAGHGLGFIDGGNVNNSTGVGNINGGGNPFIFDTFIVDGDGNSVLDLPNPSTELGDFLTSGDVFVNGQFAIEALNGVSPELFAPDPFQGGSSIAHWDEAAFPAGDINSLMSPQVGASESNFDIGPITRGHFRDMGWVLAAQAPVIASPTVFTEELNVGEVVTREVTVTNSSENPVSIAFLAPATAYELIESVTPETLEVPAGGSSVITVTLNTTGVAKGSYEETVDFDIIGFDGILDIDFNIRVLDGTEAPSIAVNPFSFEEVVEQLKIVTRELTIENVGDADLTYQISLNNEEQVTFDSRVAQTTSAIQANGFQQVSSSALSSDKGLASSLRAEGPLNKVISSLYATGFEDFTVGDLNGQGGWSTQPANFFTITDANAFEGGLHTRGTTDGSATTALAFSPLITPGNEPFMVATAQVNLQGSGSSFEIIPQSPAAGSVITRVRFNGDGTVDILDGNTGGFTPINVTVPTGYFEVRIVVDKDDFATQVYFDDALVFSGLGFAGIIEQVVLLSDNVAAGSTFDVDNVEVVDGDENAFFLTVSPTAGTVVDGDDATLQVKFDARTLEPGVYNATINISSNDTENPTIDVPVALTVVSPPSIVIAPDTLSESVDVTVDVPAVKTATFTITNEGDTALDFAAGIGATVFNAPDTGETEQAIAALDLRKYGLGSSNGGTLQAAGIKKGLQLSRAQQQLANSTVFIDSIFYDTGVNVADDFVGLNDGVPVAIGVKFDAETEFTLNAVRNAYRTEALTEATIILEIYRGGATPDAGELLTSQVITQTSEEGIFLEEVLEESQTFAAGESFWIVHKYPEGIDFPQGSFNTDSVRPDTYFFSSDGGESYTNLDNFAFLTRALSGGGDSYITLSPSRGSVASGESVEVEVVFDGSELANGIFETDILVSSNDPITPTAIVATTFEVSGQVSGIDVSEELLLFNDVFIGNSKQETFTITNTGLAQLNVSEIASDNEDFVVEPSSAVINAGEELEVTVTFAPTTTGNVNGIISITSDATDATDAIEVIVNGIGVNPPKAFLDPQELFVTTDRGTTVTKEVVLRNDGSAPLTYSFPDLALARALARPDVQFNNTELITFENTTAKPQKGFKDSRVGHQVRYSVGTDTKFGYSWIDSDEEGGPVYAAFDIRDIGTDLTEFVGADGTVEITLPYSINYYGTSYESLFVNANGFVSFEAPTTPFTFLNEQIPVADGVNNVIAPMWVDIEPQNGGSVHIATFADAAVVQWSDAPIFLGVEGEAVTFKVVLFTDGSIEFLYDDVDGASFNDLGTVGIENAAGDDGAQVAFNTPYIKDGLAVRFVRPQVPTIDFISDVTPLSGVVAAGGSKTINVTLDATTLEPGTYMDELTVSSNAPDKQFSTTAIELTVVDVPEVVSLTLINADTDEPIAVINDGDTIDFRIYDTANFNVEANIGDLAPRSVVFDFNGVERFRRENEAPYALGGDRRGDFRRVDFIDGVNTITATPYTARGGRGDAGIAKTVTFEIIGGVLPEVESFTLINADTNEAIGPLNDGDVLDVSTFDTANFSVVANVGALEAGSVVFDYNGVAEFRKQNKVPYSLGGGRDGNFRKVPFELGANTITATPYTKRGGRGDAGTANTISFEVVSPDAPEIGRLVLVNADTNEEIGAIGDGDVLDLSQYPTTGLSIIAETEGEGVGSVLFDFNGIRGYQTENAAPYALNGDRRGRYKPTFFAPGVNVLTARLYTEKRGGGLLTDEITISFEVLPVTNAASKEINASAAKVYPNPVVDVANFDMSDSGQQVLNGTLFNLLGQLVMPTFDFEVNDRGNAFLDMTNLSQGTYILRLTNDQGEIVSQVKVLKQ